MKILSKEVIEEVKFHYIENSPLEIIKEIVNIFEKRFKNCSLFFVDKLPREASQIYNDEEFKGFFDFSLKPLHWSEIKTKDAVVYETGDIICPPGDSLILLTDLWDISEYEHKDLCEKYGYLSDAGEPLLPDSLLVYELQYKVKKVVHEVKGSKMVIHYYLSITD